MSEETKKHEEPEAIDESKLTPLQRVKLQQERLKGNKGNSSGGGKGGGAAGPADGNKRVVLNRRSGGA